MVVQIAFTWNTWSEITSITLIMMVAYQFSNSDFDEVVNGGSKNKMPKILMNLIWIHKFPCYKRSQINE